MPRSARSFSLALLAASLFCLACPVPAKADKRVALLIGNGAYTDMSPLKNPKNDLALVGETLKKIGFEIITVNDADHRDMNIARGRFAKAAADAGIALVYFAGHGMQVRGRNYLIPVKAAIESQADLLTEAIRADDIIESMENTNARVRILILDACRNNPLPRLARASDRGLTQTGLAKMKSEDDLEGTLIIFSTSPGKVADDGADSQSPFAAALADHLPATGVDVFSLFNRVAEAVGQKTSGRQVPWVQGYLRSKVYLAGAPPVASERASFDRALEENSLKAWKDYLSQYPQGQYADMAQARLKILAPEIASISPSSPDRILPAAPPAPVIAPKKLDRSAFMLPESSARMLTDSDLKDMDAEQMRLARNEIYARKGRRFRDPSLTAHFSQFTWYKAVASEVTLNDIETANVNFIQIAERRLSLTSR